jgi:hypothetical protein
MKIIIISKLENPIHFLKKIIIHFLNVETDPRLQYHGRQSPPNKAPSNYTTKFQGDFNLLM